MNTPSRLADYTAQLESSQRARAFSKWARYLAGRTSENLDTAVADAVADPDIASFQKTAVAAMSQGTNSDLRRSARAFLDLAARSTLLGRLQGAFSVPPFTKTESMVANLPEAQWRAEGNPIPVCAMTFGSDTTDLTSFAFIVALSHELIRGSDDRATSIVERVLVRALRRSEDRLLLASTAAVARQQPAGLLYGVSTSGGGSPLVLDDDLRELWLAVRDGEALTPFYILSARAGQYLASLHVDGGPLFPTIGPLGGSIYGVPALISPAAEGKLILLDASALIVTDEGAELDTSTQAAVQMSDSPSGAAQQVSSFQANCAFLRFTRYVSWMLAADDAVGYINLPI